MSDVINRLSGKKNLPLLATLIDIILTQQPFPTVGLGFRWFQLLPGTSIQAVTPPFIIPMISYLQGGIMILKEGELYEAVQNKEMALV